MGHIPMESTNCKRWPIKQNHHKDQQLLTVFECDCVAHRT